MGARDSFVHARKSLTSIKSSWMCRVLVVLHLQDLDQGYGPMDCLVNSSRGPRQATRKHGLAKGSSPFDGIC